MKPEAPAELLAWDTDFFRRRIARVRGDTLDEARASHLAEWCRSNRVECLYFLARAGDSETIRSAEKHGFNLVDVRVTLERKTGAAENAVLAGGIRPARAADVPVLQSVARTAHTDTRFFSDVHFSRERAEDLYATWIALECQGRAQAVWVAASPADDPLGYISCHIDSERRTGQVGLVGISEGSRGRGIGKNLVFAGFNWLAAQGVTDVTVVTQGCNIAAQRLYQRCGFITKNLQFWYHKWHSAC